jgi:methyltransferase-like protein
VQAADGALVTSLLRRPVEVDELARAVLLQLDGSRTVDGVLEAIVGRVVSGSLEMSDGSGPIRDPEAARKALGGEIEPAIRRLARRGLLLG